MIEWISYPISLLIHEAFHLLTACLVYKQGFRIFLTPAGFSGKWKNFQPGRLAQCIICAAGPLGNLAMAAVFALMPFGIFKDLARAGLFIGIFNMIPLYPMDGGNILLVFLYNYVGSRHAYLIMKRTGQGIRFFLLIAGVFLIIHYRNPSLFLAVIFLPGKESVKGR